VGHSHTQSEARDRHQRLGDRKGHLEVLLVANTGSSGKTAKSQQRARGGCPVNPARARLLVVRSQRGQPRVEAG
jgi:hypothetical protein